MGKVTTYGALAITLSGAILLGGACTKLSLEHREPAGYAYIDMAWDGVPAPMGSRFWLYPASGGVVELTGTGAGFEGSITPGEYRVIATNLDARNIGFRSMESYDTAELYVAVADDGSGLAHPERAMLAVSGAEATLQVNDRDTVRLHLDATDRIRYVRLLLNVDTDVAVTTCTGRMTGISPSILCATGAATAETAEVTFSATATQTEGSFRADIAVLDLARAGEAPLHLLTLNLGDDAGGTAAVNVDMSEAIRSLIENAGGTLPEEIPLSVTLEAVDGTLHASVKPWDTGGTGAGDL